MGTNKSPRISVGIASLVVIFTVLCLTVFSVLSLSTALTELSLAEKSSQSVRDYYAADLKCTDMAEQIGAFAKQNLLQEDLRSQVESLGVQMTLQEDGWLVSYHKSVDNNQELFVLLSIQDDQVKVQSWQVQRTGQWEPDDRILVWSGD